MGDGVDGARGRLGQCAAERGRMAVLQDHAARAEGRRRAEDGPDILRVGDLVEHDQDPAGGTGEIV